MLVCYSFSWSLIIDLVEIQCRFHCLQGTSFECRVQNRMAQLSSHLFAALHISLTQTGGMLYAETFDCFSGGYKHISHSYRPLLHQAHLRPSQHAGICLLLSHTVPFSEYSICSQWQWAWVYSSRNGTILEHCYPLEVWWALNRTPSQFCRRPRLVVLVLLGDPVY